MIAYFKCMCRASDKKHARVLRELGYEIRVVKRNPALLEEIKQYGLKMPFKVTNGKAEKI